MGVGLAIVGRCEDEVRYLMGLKEVDFGFSAFGKTWSGVLVTALDLERGRNPSRRN